MKTFKIIIFVVLFGEGLFSHACAPINSSFNYVGRLILSDGNNYRANYDASYLGPMLGVLYENDGLEIQYLSIKIEEKNRRIEITQHLRDGQKGRQFEHDVFCFDDEWHYVISGKTNAEGIIREYEYDFGLKVVLDGDLFVVRKIKIVRGLFFKSQTSTTDKALFTKF